MDLDVVRARYDTFAAGIAIGRNLLRGQGDGRPCAPLILAGPTCDSADILYRRRPYELPTDLAIGDPIDFLSAGAYTTSVTAVGFNGFPPIRSYFV